MKLHSFIILLCVVLSLSPLVYCFPDPAAVYCKKAGFEYVVNRTDNGTVCLCRFPDGSTARIWDFLKGAEKQEYNYCVQKGLDYVVLEDSDRCPAIYHRNCVLCILPDGGEVEVTRLMQEEGVFPSFSVKKEPEPSLWDYLPYALGVLAVLALVVAAFTAYRRRREKREIAAARRELEEMKRP